MQVKPYFKTTNTVATDRLLKVERRIIKTYINSVKKWGLTLNETFCNEIQPATRMIKNQRI